MKTESSPATSVVEDEDGCIGCGSLGKADRATSRGDAAFFRGQYLVPVADPALEPYATYDVPVIRVRKRADVELSYDFPPELTGVVQDADFYGSSLTAGVMRGPAGTARCDAASDTCTETLPGIAINKPALRDHFRWQGMPQKEIDARLRVTDVFIGDPIGILEFHEPRKRRGGGDRSDDMTDR